MSKTLHGKHLRSKASLTEKNHFFEKSRWSTRIHVESRNGRTGYVIEFSNGYSIVTLRGGFSKSPTTAAVEDEAFAAAANWLAHVRPDQKTPTPPIKKLHYIRSKTNPNNRQRREHRAGRRAA